ncbi:hypothetical protein BDZ89DRAFT_1128226 [Hymenopellis radicata]|nr:hypothetical protein BDZ89DRAFT_1128226 [Hymenopellis radicata]
MAITLKRKETHNLHFQGVVTSRASCISSSLLFLGNIAGGYIEAAASIPAASWRWHPGPLTQDKMYAAHAYPPLYRLPHLSHPSHAIGSPEEKLNQRILVFSLTNVRVIRQVNFFEDTAKRWTLKIAERHAGLYG